MSNQKDSATIEPTEGVEVDSELAIEKLMELDHSVLFAAFGRKVGEALEANEGGNPYAPLAVKGLLESILYGLVPEASEDTTPADFLEAMTSWSRTHYEPESFFQQLWFTRINERFVESKEWEQWPEQKLTGSVRTIETGKYVPTMSNSEEIYFLNRKDGLLVRIMVDYRGELSTYIWGKSISDIDDLIGEVDDYVCTPDPYEGRVLRMESSSIRILDLEVGELTGYSKDVEKAVSWMSSIADPKVRKRLAKASLPARAGLLLEGPPGSGKTTLTRRIASDLAGDATVIYATPDVSIESVFSFSNRYEPVLIILEDVESFFGERGESDFSSFLNELDGIDQEAGKMVLATSNDSSDFDEAIRRPGRLERRAVIAGVQPGAHNGMVLARLPKEPEEVVEALVAIIREKSKGRTVTPAVIDSLARHAIMLKLRGKALVRYAEKTWEPHYDGESYLEDKDYSDEA